MRTLTIAMVTTSLVALTGCSSSLKQHPNTYIKQPTVCVDKGWYGYYQGKGCPSTAKAAAAPDASAERLAALERERQQLADELAAARRQNGALSSRVSDLERQLADRDREIAALRSGSHDTAALASQLSAAQSEKDRLAAELAAARQHIDDHDRLAAESESQFAALKQRNSDLESQLADRDKELSGIRGDLSEEMAKLKQAERGLIRALRPEINKGDIMVDLNSERLLINLASGYLFGSGEDQLKSAGADALQRVGGVLKDFPEKQVHVAGYTDKVPIKGALQKKYPSNKELSDARANGAAQALRDGGVISNLSAAGHGESDPIAGNNTAEGRAKNRRVEVSVK